MSAKRLLFVPIVVALLLPSWAASQPTAVRDNKGKPPPKKTPPKPQPPRPNMQQFNRAAQNLYAQQMALQYFWWLNTRANMRPNWRYPAWTGLFPSWAMPFAGLVPGYTPPGAAPPESMAGNQKEVILQVAKTASVFAPRTGGGYQPSKVDALKADQNVTVLVKSADKPATWTLAGKVIAFEAGDPAQLTILARLDPAQAEFDPAGKFVTAVTIRNAPAVAQK